MSELAFVLALGLWLGLFHSCGLGLGILELDVRIRVWISVGDIVVRVVSLLGIRVRDIGIRC